MTPQRPPPPPPPSQITLNWTASLHETWYSIYMMPLQVTLPLHSLLSYHQYTNMAAVRTPFTATYIGVQKYCLVTEYSKYVTFINEFFCTT
jgi:hypothetical protein